MHNDVRGLIPRAIIRKRRIFQGFLRGRRGSMPKERSDAVRASASESLTKRNAV